MFNILNLSTNLNPKNYNINKEGKLEIDDPQLFGDLREEYEKTLSEQTQDSPSLDENADEFNNNKINTIDDLI